MQVQVLKYAYLNKNLMNFRISNSPDNLFVTNGVFWSRDKNLEWKTLIFSMSILNIKQSLLICELWCELATFKSKYYYYFNNQVTSNFQLMNIDFQRKISTFRVYIVKLTFPKHALQATARQNTVSPNPIHHFQNFWQTRKSCYIDSVQIWYW